jgi:hypothetical protein
MASTELIPGPSAADDNGSALKAFLDRTTIHETAGAAIPRDLLQFGLYGSLLVIASGILALIAPSPESIRSGDFFLILGTPAASLEAFMHALAVPAIVGGLLLLGLDLYLSQVRSSEHWHTAVVAQAAAGGVGGLVGVVFLALLLINLVLWVLIIACGLGLCLMVLAGMGD